jgi:streptogramin lyase
MVPPASPMSSASSPSIRELGVPVKAVNWVRLHPGRTVDGQPSLLASMGQNNGGPFVLDIDLATGHCRQFPVQCAHAEAPTAAMRSLRTGILWVGTAWQGHLHRYDPAHPERGLENLGRIDPELATFPTGITETPDGMIWIGAYPGASLTRFNPATGEFKRFGRMDTVDKYLYPLAADDGSLVAQVKMTTYSLITINPATGEHHRIGPVLETPSANPQRYEFFKGTDGKLYLESYAGNFLLESDGAKPVATQPAQLPGVHATYKHGYQQILPLPDGSIATFADDLSFEFRRVRLTPANGGAPREITLDWQGGGTGLWTIHLGPDRRIYGSSMLPEHLFSCDLDGGNMVNHGQCSVSGGEAYSMCNYDGKLAIASYPASRISLYDPALPYRFGTGPGANPLDVGRADGASTRPHSMIVAPDGKLWIGSAADYGLLDGSLAWYDPATALRGSHRGIIPNCTPFILLWLPELRQILVGFNSEPGTGVSAKVQRAGYALWDTVADQAVYIGDFDDPELVDVCSLLPAGNGLVYALSGRNPRLVTHYDCTPAPTRLLLLDPAQRRVIQASPLPENFGKLPFESGHILRTDNDGTLYGVTTTTVFRIKPGTVEMSVVATITGQPLTVVGPIVDGTLYFASDYMLRSLTLR